jgi:hypothetical protein
MGKVFSAVGRLFGGSDSISSSTPAQESAPASAPVIDSVTDTASSNLKKRSKGKSNLTISSNASGGTGLNV